MEYKATLAKKARETLTSAQHTLPTYRAERRTVCRLGLAFGFLAMAAIAASPALAADDCANLRVQVQQNDLDAFTLVQNNPGSSAVFAACMGVGLSQYHGPADAAAATRAFAVCAGLSCIATDSYSNCISVAVQLFSMLLRKATLESQLRQSGCE